MSSNYLAYWVFTSGEEGEHGLDWGVKFASPSLPDRKNLDIRHRELLKEFGLPPSTAHFENGNALCLLPYEDGFVLSFIFPGTDHGGRPNTSAIVCVINSKVAQAMTVNQVVQSIWKNNNLTEIAARNSQIRPDNLLMDVEIETLASSPVFSPEENWPTRNIGYLQIGDNLKTLAKREKIAESKEKKGNKFLLSACIFITVIILMIALNRSDTSKEKLPDINENETISISNDVFNENDKKVQPVLPQKAKNTNVISDKKDNSLNTTKPYTLSKKDAEIFKDDLKSFVKNYKILSNKKRIRLQLRSENIKNPLRGYISIFEKANVLDFDIIGMKITLHMPTSAQTSDSLDKCLDNFLSQFMKGEKGNE